MLGIGEVNMDREIPALPGEERNDIDLGLYFNLREFACRCGKYCGGFTVYGPRLVQGLTILRIKLSILADASYVGDPRVILNCAARCFKHNEEIGGVPDSEHLFQGGHAAADVSTAKTDLSPLEVALLVWGQDRTEIELKFPGVGEQKDRHFLAAKIEEFRRVGVYGKDLHEPGYHGKKGFIHVGVATKFKKVTGDPSDDNLIALPSRWGDWPDKADFYRAHPELYKGRG